MSHMEIDAVLAQMRTLKSQAAQARSGDEAIATDFVRLLEDSIAKVNETQIQAGNLARAFEQGEEVPLAEVMVSLQKARVSFQAMVQVRNKLVEAYKDIMNMPI
ncbi:MAG: flagellar hook-basal body complex protein FliE [Methylohalobius sp.]|nr:flagellar hook-basal body complex protein FliE [Methylohalobius sp.]